MTIRNQILCTMLVVSIVPLAIASWFVYQETIPEITENIDRNLVVLVDEIAREIDTFLWDNIETIRANSHIPGLAEFLTGGSTYRAQNEPTVTEILRNVIIKDPVNVTSCGLLNMQGKNILDTASDFRDCNEGDALYFKEAIAKGLPYISNVSSSACSPGSALFVSTPIRDGLGQIVGVIRIRYEAARLQQLVVRSNQTPDIERPYAILIDENSTVIAHGEDPSLQLNSTILTASPEAQPSGNGELKAILLTSKEFHDINGIHYGWGNYRSHGKEMGMDRIVSKDLQYMPWQLAVFIHADAYDKPVHKAELFLLGGFLLSTALVFIAARLAAQRIANPIAELTQATKAISVGNLGPIKTIHSSGEVALLVDTFNSMTLHLNESLQGLEKRHQEQVKTESALRDSEEKYRIMAELTGQMVYDYDVRTGTIIWSGAIFEITGFSPEEFKGIDIEKWQNKIYAEDREHALNLLEQATRSGRPYQVEYRFTTKNGELIFIEDNGSFLYDPEGKSYRMLGNMKNITTSKQLEENLRQAQKMEAIGTLAGGIAHDFNNILGGIIGYTELAQLDIAQDNPGQEDLRQVLKSADRAKELVRQILSFSRKSQEEHKPVSIAMIVEEVTKLLHSTIPSTVTITSTISCRDAMVNADPTQLHQIFMNLCTNSAQAMQKSGGILKIALSSVTLPQESEPDHQILPPGPYVKITVSDSGNGIDPAIIHRIFDPFFTTKEKERGTGMGLAVVHGIVKATGGDITVASLPHRGATFTILLPRIVAPPAEEEEDTISPEGGSEHILFVDDEQTLTDLWALILESLNYQVTPFTSSTLALEEFRHHPERYDLVITDYTMPDMTGFDMARAILSIRPSIPIILCTGYSDSITPKKTERVGIKALLYKPITREQLAKAIQDVMG